LRSNRRQCGLQVLERLHCLQTKVAAQFAVAIEPELARDIDKPSGDCGLDYLGVARWLGQTWWIYETELAHHFPLVLRRGFRTI
jgi:hypothetical protein